MLAREILLGYNVPMIKKVIKQVETLFPNYQEQWKAKNSKPFLAQCWEGLLFIEFTFCVLVFFMVIVIKISGELTDLGLLSANSSGFLGVAVILIVIASYYLFFVLTETGQQVFNKIVLKMASFVKLGFSLFQPVLISCVGKIVINIRYNPLFSSFISPVPTTPPRISRA